MTAVDDLVTMRKLMGFNGFTLFVVGIDLLIVNPGGWATIFIAFTIGMPAVFVGVGLSIMALGSIPEAGENTRAEVGEK